MGIEDSVKQFSEQFPALMEEETKLTNQLFEIVKKKIEALEPVVNLMKHYRFYFWHPDLGTRFKTTHGIIVGRNLHNNAEIYVIGPNYEFVDQVDGYTGEVTKKAALSTREFLKICDLDFFFKGLEHIESFLDQALNEKQQKIAEKRNYIERYS